MLMGKTPLLLMLSVLFMAVPVLEVRAETLEEYKERMERERREAEQEDDEDDNPNYNEDKSVDWCGGCLSFSSCLVEDWSCVTNACSGPWLSGLFDGIGSIRFADYPYAPNRDFDFATIVTEETQNAKNAERLLTEKYLMVEFSIDGSYLFGQEIPMFDVQALLKADFTIVHCNFFFQYIIDAEGTGLSTFSANAGFSLPIQRFIISIFAGMFVQEGFPIYPSFGVSTKYFFPGNIIFSVYSLFSVYDPFFFIIVVPTVEVALDRFTIGVGFNIYDYNRLVLYGPTLKIAAWF